MLAVKSDVTLRWNFSLAALLAEGWELRGRVTW